MCNYNLIVFDWDGTLYNSGAYIVHCFQKAAQETKLKMPKAESIKNVIGLSYEEVLNKIMPDLTQEQRDVFTMSYRKNIRNSLMSKPVLFAGVEDVLRQLIEAGYLLAIATGKGRRSLNDDLNMLNLNDYFVTTRSAEETFSKPHPQMLLEIIGETGVKSENVLMVGDTEYDLQLAANAKVDALAVDYGMHERERLLTYRIKGCISDIRELPGWLGIKN